MDRMYQVAHIICVIESDLVKLEAKVKECKELQIVSQYSLREWPKV